MNLLVFASVLLAEHGEEVGSSPIGTPFWVPLLVILIVVLLFWWGLTRNQIVEVPDAHGHGDAHDEHGDAHGHDDGPGEGHDHAADHAAARTAVAEPAPTPEPASPPAAPDDLKIIEGIGPKISSILAAAGITTFAQLAATSVESLNKIVREDAGITIAFPDTWPEQAALAAAGKWHELEALQENLKGGRRE